jgi:hypothetical protein
MHDWIDSLARTLPTVPVHGAPVHRKTFTPFCTVSRPRAQRAKVIDVAHRRCIVNLSPIIQQQSRFQHLWQNFLSFKTSIFLTVVKLTYNHEPIRCVASIQAIFAEEDEPPKRQIH